MLDPALLLCITCVCYTFTSAFPASQAPSRATRTVPSSINLILNPALNSSAPVSTAAGHFLTGLHTDPYCFTDAFIPIIDPKDCPYTSYEISHDPKFGPSISKPLIWFRGKRWRARSCAIALVPNVQKPKDTFSRLDILTQAHRIEEKCQKAPHGFRGGFVGVGKDEFQVIMKRPVGNVPADDMQ